MKKRQKPGPKPRFGEAGVTVTAWVPLFIAEWLMRTAGDGSVSAVIAEKLIEDYRRHHVSAD